MAVARTNNNPGSVYSRLRTELDDLAATLAAATGPQGPAASTLGEAALVRYPSADRCLARNLQQSSRRNRQ